MPGWLALRIKAPVSIHEPLTNFLFEQGALGCQEQDELVIAYFQDRVNKRQVEQAVKSYIADLCEMGLAKPDYKIEWNEIPDQDWNAEWKKHFKPVVVSERFTVKPTWETLASPETDFVLNIDPKQAFGTGTHATTILMLQLLEQLPVAGKTVLDVGTGTGILAIAAHLLGAESVTAIDIDPVAIEAAQENIANNLDRDHNISFLANGIADFKSRIQFDLILANLTKNVLIQHLDNFVSHSKKNSRMIFSGILLEEMKEMTAELSAHGILNIRRELYRDEWVALLLERYV